eukprot:Pgem_evm1s5867
MIIDSSSRKAIRNNNTLHQKVQLLRVSDKKPKKISIKKTPEQIQAAKDKQRIEEAERQNARLLETGSRD